MRDRKQASPEYREYTSQDYTGRSQRFRVKPSDLISLNGLNFFRAVEIFACNPSGEKQWLRMPSAAIIDNGREKFLAYHTEIDGGLGVTCVRYDGRLNSTLLDAGVEVVNYSCLEEKVEEKKKDWAAAERHLQTAVNKFKDRDRRGLALLVGSLDQRIQRNEQNVYLISDAPVFLSYREFGPEDVEEVLRYVRYHQRKHGKDFSEALVRFLLHGLDDNLQKD
ncbi:hypothetical protein HY501_00655 [Candidatus Woesearchaeota archaeon]|nr:hypothetical protein [Candidatus Woesearchaeota archaeon]